MREKLNALPVAQLREIAKANGIKGISGLKKAELVEKLLELNKVLEEKQRAEQQKAQQLAAEQQKAQQLAAQQQAAEQQKAQQLAAQQQRAQQQAAMQDQTMEQKLQNAPMVQQNQTEEKSTERTEEPGQKKTVSQKKENNTEKAQKKNYKNNNRLQGKNQNRDEKYRQYKKKDEKKNNESSADNSSKDEKNTEIQTSADIRNDNETAQLQASANVVQDNSEIIEKAEFDYASQAELSENTETSETVQKEKEESKLDSGIVAHGILEVMSDGYGFIRSANYMPGDSDVYVSPSQIKKFWLKTGDILEGKVRVKTQNEKFGALLKLDTVNGVPIAELGHRRNFEDLTPIFPNERLKLEILGTRNNAMRIFDIISPIGKGQRGMIVSPPKAGKTTLLKGVAHSIQRNNPEVHIIILLIDERPEEVTDIREDIVGNNVEVIYSTFDELPEHHKRVSEMVIERAKRLVEMQKDVVILLDSITRLARAYNLLVPPSGRTLSGGLDPAALYMPKRFFGAARNIREGGSLTILATALVDTGSKMDDVVYEEFKGTGNMELILDRKLQERRIFPAIDIAKSGTRREDLLLTPDEQEAAYIIHKATGGLRAEETTEKILDLFVRTKNNIDFVDMIRKIKLI